MKAILTIVIIVMFPNLLKSQIITTIAGSGANIFSGNGIPATTAGIPNPRGACFDKFGNFYFTDGSAQRVRKVDINNIITTVAGNGLGGFIGDGGPATNARLNWPIAVSCDSNGNLYIADGSNNR